MHFEIGSHLEKISPHACEAFCAMEKTMPGPWNTLRHSIAQQPFPGLSCINLSLSLPKFTSAWPWDIGREPLPPLPPLRRPLTLKTLVYQLSKRI